MTFDQCVGDCEDNTRSRKILGVSPWLGDPVYQAPLPFGARLPWTFQLLQPCFDQLVNSVVMRYSELSFEHESLRETH